MNKNAVIPVAMLFHRVKKTRGNLDLSIQSFMTVLRELQTDNLFEWFGNTPEFSEDSLIARSQMHFSIPISDAIPL
jgi:hypothetical protein